MRPIFRDCFYSRWKFILLPLTVAIMLVRAAAARNASPLMENQHQLASYFCYPLVAGILDLAETCPTWGPTEDELPGCQPFTTESVAIYLVPTIKEELFCKQEIGIKQPWNFSVEIKFTVVKFLSVLIFVDATNDDFLTAKISRITVWKKSFRFFLSMHLPCMWFTDCLGHTIHYCVLICI